MPFSPLSKWRCAPARATLAAVFLACAATVTTPPALAAVMQISPVQVDFSPGQRAQTLQVVNKGKDAMSAQVRVMRWTQANGRDVLEPATDVVASPAILKVKAGNKQTVRLVRLNTAAPARQETYRVLLNELPTEEVQRWSGVRLLQSHSIPVFVESMQDQQAAGRRPAKSRLTNLDDVRAQMVAGKAGSADLRVTNSGNRALRISNVFTESGGGQLRSVEGGLLGYVLPGEQMSWPIRLAYPLPTGLTLKARFNDDTEAQAVPLEGSGR